MSERIVLGQNEAEVLVNIETCTGCGLCTRVCIEGPLVLVDGKARVRPDSKFGCIGCGQCAAVCPTGSVAVRGRGMTSEDVVPLPGAERCASAEQLENLLLSRRSVRQFASGPVSREMIESVLRISATAPMGIPPFNVGAIVFDSPQKVRELAVEVVETFKKFRKTVFSPVALRVMGLFMNRATKEMMASFVGPLLKAIVDGQAKGKDYLCYDAPAAILFHYSPYADASDATIVATYAMVAAHSLGLGTCMIGSVAPAVNRNKALKSRIGLPAENKAGILLILGHPAITYRRAIRRRLASTHYV